MATSFDNFLHNVLNDLRVELMDEFDRNFERKGFFDKAWPGTKQANNRGSLMMRTGDLRKGNKCDVKDGRLEFTNSMPYAALHNEGGELTVTLKMKKFFWAMYLKATGAITKRKDGTASTSQVNVNLTQEAAYWKSLALMKLGKKIKIPQRQFIGPHPRVDAIVKEVADHNVKEIIADITRQLQNP